MYDLGSQSPIDLVCDGDSKETIDYPKSKETTMQMLQEWQDTPLVLSYSEESKNSTSLKTSDNREDSKHLCHWGSGCDSRNGGRLSAKHDVFVVGVDGKPLTPTTSARARKLMRDKQAQPMWNKFGMFGLRMIVNTGKSIPKSVLGVDFGTKFEGYAVAVGKENNLAVMWKLPDKDKIVKKIEERMHLRRARRKRKNRNRVCGINNRRKKKGYISPSQFVIVLSRLKAIKELFRCYKFDSVAVENIKFNYRDNPYSKNFITVEVGKTKIYGWIKENAELVLFGGNQTKGFRKKYGYKKTRNKNEEIFNSHCSDALAIATDIYAKQHIEPGRFIIVDDTYRPIRRKLHDTQFSKGHIRNLRSKNIFNGIRKGTLCEFGQICGYRIRYRNNKKYLMIVKTKGRRIEKRMEKAQDRIRWFSHRFKTKEVA